MKLIVGLGNPGAQYKNTRHNFGFMVVDEFAIINGLSWRYSQDWMCHFIKTDQYILAKPSTYMNRSGSSIKQVASFFKIQSKDILVIHDDLDLEFGKIRLSFSRTSAGHKGVESAISSMGSFEFLRLRLGIGRPLAESTDLEKYVLLTFTEDELAHLEEIIKSAIDAISSYLESGISATMNRFN